MKLTDREWKAFRIGTLFEVKGTVTTKPGALIAGGNTPRITCSATNNGLDKFYYNIPTETGNVLTVDSAAIGFVAYQEHDFIATDHVEKLVLKKHGLSLPLGVFMKSVIDKAAGGKFNYGYGFSQDRIKRQIVMLPVTDDGEPDYDFMEQYIKDLMLQKYFQYMFF